eukprot:4009372-Pyramimonas_sp.AAC.1
MFRDLYLPTGAHSCCQTYTKPCSVDCTWMPRKSGTALYTGLHQTPTASPTAGFPRGSRTLGLCYARAVTWLHMRRCP